MYAIIQGEEDCVRRTKEFRVVTPQDQDLQPLTFVVLDIPHSSIAYPLQ